MELKVLRPLLCVQERINEISPLNFMMVMDMAEDSSFFWSDNFRLVCPGKKKIQLSVEICLSSLAIWYHESYKKMSHRLAYVIY